MENILYYYKNLLEFDLRKNKCQLSQTDKQSSTHPNKIQTELKNQHRPPLTSFLSQTH